MYGEKLVIGQEVDHNRPVCLSIAVKEKLTVDSPYFRAFHSGPGPPHCRGFTIPLRHIAFRRITRQVICLSQKPLPDNTQRSQRDLHPWPRKIRNRNRSKRTAEDPRLKTARPLRSLPYLLAHNVFVFFRIKVVI